MAETPEVPAVEYQKGPANGEQLPQGEAQSLNEGVQTAKDLGEQNAQAQASPDEYQPEEVQYAPPPSVRQGLPGGESDNLLFGPTDRPQESITSGRVPPSVGSEPHDLPEWLPALQEAAADPNAPVQLKNMLKLILHHSGQ